MAAAARGRVDSITSVAMLCARVKAAAWCRVEGRAVNPRIVAVWLGHAASIASRTQSVRVVSFALPAGIITAVPICSRHVWMMAAAASADARPIATARRCGDRGTRYHAPVDTLSVV